MSTAVAPPSKKSAPAPAKMKKPSVPLMQTNGNTVKAAVTATASGAGPSSSPSTAAKRLPGQAPPTPVSTSAASATTAANSTTHGRPARRQQRISTRTGTADGVATKRTMKEFPEPYVVKQSHILKKYRKCPPSLKVHLHPTHFRFDQQDGSFSYHSEMRIFMEHLQKGTVPHDMVEEFRKAEVPFYDGWLIVRVVDHRSSTTAAGSVNGANDGEKAFSIHNYTQYITPSPYAPYPTKEQASHRSPQVRQSANDASTGKDTASETPSDATVEAQPKANSSQPRTFTVALRPTNLSRHMDLVVDAMAPDPKLLNRKQSTANINGRTPASSVPPQTPLSGVPSTPAGDKGPPAKKLKMKIEAKDLLEYEARTINATALPIYLDPVTSLEEVEALIAALTDPFYDTLPPSPKSRKRTVAELAADDAYAKEQERFMLIMDERTAAGNGTSTAAAAVDAQAGGALFQPRFEKFNALDSIKRELAERKQRDKERQMQEDETRRASQEQQAEVRRRNEQMRQREQTQREQRQMQEAAHRQAVQQQVLSTRNQGLQAQQQAQQQAGGIPPNMQGRMMAPAQTSSPIIRQGTPQHAASSPVVNNLNAGTQGLTATQAAGSPARPGSAVQHAHPGVAMARGASNQGAPSRNGTPQIPNSTPGMPNATPVMRQPTPAHSMSQASPHASMMAPTPQMAQAQATGMAQGQIPNGMQGQQLTPQQMAEISRQRMMQQQLMAHIQAQQMAQKQQAHRAAMAASPAQGTAQYNAGLAEHAKQRMQHLQQQGQGQSSPTPNHSQMTSQPQQQGMNINLAQPTQIMQRNQAMQQQAQHQAGRGNNGGQMMGNPGGQQQIPQQQQGAGQPGAGAGQTGPQQQRPMNLPPQMHQVFQGLCNQFHARCLQQLAQQRYNGNIAMISHQEQQEAGIFARKAAYAEMQKRVFAAHQQQQGTAGGGTTGVNQAQLQALVQHQQHQQMQMQMAQMQGQAGGGGMGMNVNMTMNGMQGLGQQGGGGGGGVNQGRANGNGMQQMHHYQQQLNAMQRQTQAQQAVQAAASAQQQQQNQGAANGGGGG
ncbi:hypothetical protein DV736_g4266, partial [Chaetothyriales sp. CBS 134916]